MTVIQLYLWQLSSKSVRPSSHLSVQLSVTIRYGVQRLELENGRTWNTSNPSTIIIITQIYCILQPGGWINIKHNKNKNYSIIQQINRLFSYV